MNSVVVLHAVRDPRSFVVNRKAQKVFVNREAYVTNPADRHALEAALRLAGDGDTVTAVAYGGPSAETVLYAARALGASRALWVQGDRTAPLDSLVLTKVIERVVAHLGGADLVLLGATVLDADLAQAGPRLAAALEWAFVPEAWALKAAGGTVQAVVRGSDGYRRVEADRPAVVSVAADSHPPRYPAAGAIMRVYETPGAIETMTLEGLGLTEADLTPGVRLRGEAFPPERTWGAKVERVEDVLTIIRAAQPRQDRR